MASSFVCVPLLSPRLKNGVWAVAMAAMLQPRPGFFVRATAVSAVRGLSKVSSCSTADTGVAQRGSDWPD
jgi:hypothetical protein